MPLYSQRARVAVKYEEQPNSGTVRRGRWKTGDRRTRQKIRPAPRNGAWWKRQQKYPRTFYTEHTLLSPYNLILPPLVRVYPRARVRTRGCAHVCVCMCVGDVTKSSLAANAFAEGDSRGRNRRRKAPVPYLWSVKNRSWNHVGEFADRLRRIIERNDWLPAYAPWFDHPDSDLGGNHGNSCLGDRLTRKEVRESLERSWRYSTERILKREMNRTFCARRKRKRDTWRVEGIYAVSCNSWWNLKRWFYFKQWLKNVGQNSFIRDFVLDKSEFKNL